MTEIEKEIQVAGEALQIVRLNPNAALQKRIESDGLWATGNEYDVTVGGILYRAQRGEDPKTGEVWYYYCRVPHWDQIWRFQRASIPPPPPPVANWYVSPSGNDANPGTQDAPFRTINYTVGVMGPGDVVLIEQGTYHETINFSCSGTVNAPIIFRFEDGAIIDGEYTLPGPPYVGVGSKTGIGWSYKRLVTVSGAYLHFENMTVQRADARGVQPSSSSHHIVFDNCTFRECSMAGVYNFGSNITFSDCKLYGNCCWQQSGSFQADWNPALYIEKGSGIIIDNCMIYENWGEGIILGRSCTGATVHDCTIYDNSQGQIYLSRCQNVTVERNLVYHTWDSNYFRSNSNHPGFGIIAHAETQFSGYQLVKNCIIRNNIVIGGYHNLGCWHDDYPLENVQWLNNTALHAWEYDVTLIPQSAINCRFANNVVVKGPRTYVQGGSKVQADHNCWSETGGISGAGDVVGDPLLADANHALAKGMVLPEWYKLTPNSPCVGAGASVAEVTEDLWRTARKDPPCIGAHEI